MDKTSGPEKIVGALSTTGCVTNDKKIVASWLRNGMVKRFLSKEEKRIVDLDAYGRCTNWNYVISELILDFGISKQSATTAITHAVTFLRREIWKKDNVY